MKKIMLAIVIVSLFVCIVFYAVTCRGIFLEVKATTDLATHRFGGDKVKATIALLKSSQVSFELRNKAVYALGQIGGEKALPALQDQVTGIPCEKPCTKKDYICQYNLETAIKCCRGGFSATRWMYRFL